MPASIAASQISASQPDRDCPLCPRLYNFIQGQRAEHGDWHNAPVPSFGADNARFLIVGLAPGLRGANRTGRPFTGDYAGKLLYPTLIKFGLAKGEFLERPDDGMTLVDTRITNAVRCVPPQNKPETAEIKTCNSFLIAELAAMPKLKAILALGSIAHGAVLGAFKLKKSAYSFGHAAMHELPNGITLANSYHCSRLNTNTGRLTTAMFENVIRDIKTRL